MRVSAWAWSLGYDLRLALRGLLRRPAFTIAALLTLTLGIGVNTAIFSVVNAVMLQPLPFGDPDRLVRIYESNLESGQTDWAVSDPNFLDWHAQTESWEALAAFDSGKVALTMDTEVSVLQELRVTPEFLPALGFQPALGRSFTADEAQVGGETNVAIISDGLWRRAFSADPDVIGATARINDTPHTIIGVLPAEFDWDDADDFDWDEADLLRPRVLANQARGDRRLSVIGLLMRDVTLEQGRSELTAVAAQLAEEYPIDNAGWSVSLVPFNEWLVPRQVRDSLVLLQGAVLLVLLIACINVANLFLARGATRRKETAIRVTVGASRVRIAWHGLVESTVLALISAVAGIGLASAIIEVLSAYGESIVPRVDGALIDGAVLSFGFICALVCVAVSGLLPSLHAARENGLALHGTSRGSAGAYGARRMRTSLMVAEVSLSVALLIGAGLLLRSFITLQQVDTGFDVDSVMTARVLPANATDVNTYEKRRAFWARVTDEVSNVPGITGVATTSAVPFSARNTGTEITIPGAPDLSDTQPSADWRMVSPGYFAAMGIPLQGRDFTQSDGPDAPPVIIINEALARQYWPNESAVGKTIIPGSFGNRERTIIGVAGDVPNFGLEGAVGPMIYYSGLEAAVIFDWMYLVWRSALDPESQISTIRDAIHRVNPEIAIYDIVPASQLLSGSFQSRRFNLYLLGIFAAVAMVLAVIGLFSVMVYLVSQQTREIGVRLAVGATRANVFLAVVGRGLILAAIGAGTGVIAAIWLTQLLEGFLFSVSRTDPLVFAAVPSLMIAVAAIACCVPARRAMRVDPMSALRVD